MTADEFARLRALCAAATIEDWQYSREDVPDGGAVETDNGLIGFLDPPLIASRGEADLRFIAAARSAVPALLDALEQATTLVAELRGELRNRVRYIEMPPQTAAMLAKMLPWEVSE